MRILVGTDITEIERIRHSVEKLGRPFLTKIFTEGEIAYCEGRGRKNMKATRRGLRQKKPSPRLRNRNLQRCAAFRN